jgi:hypothetical protein
MLELLAICVKENKKPHLLQRGKILRDFYLLKYSGQEVAQKNIIDFFFTKMTTQHIAARHSCSMIFIHEFQSRENHWKVSSPVKCVNETLSKGTTTNCSFSHLSASAIFDNDFKIW